jgi:hypothetical protein
MFDTWNGTPYDDPLCHHKAGEWKAPLDECKVLVGNSDFTHYHTGVFPDSVMAEGSEKQTYSFVFVDMDTEQATRDAIHFFWPRIIPGGKMVLDDWAWPPCAGVEKAVRENFRENQLKIVGNICIVEKQ